MPRILKTGPTVKMKPVLKPLEQDLSNELMYTKIWVISENH